MEVMEHCSPEKVESLVNLWPRLLKPDGVLIVSVPIEIGPSLPGKELVRAFAGWRGVGDYKSKERYRLGELAEDDLRGPLDGARCARRSPCRLSDGTTFDSHLHKGFNWTALVPKLAGRFDVGPGGVHADGLVARPPEQPGVDRGPSQALTRSPRVRRRCPARPAPDPRPRRRDRAAAARATSRGPSSSRWPRRSARAIESTAHLMVEAGTGVGKSFAYLVPAILAAAEAGKKVVVSTHTISLQEQLLQKDLPFLRAVMPQEFSAVLVKGRSNYISLRRLDAAVARAGATFQQPEEFDQLAEIRLWAGRTERRQPVGPRLPPVAGASGTPSPARTATAWAGSARGTRTASTSRPGGGCGRPTSWSSTTPCS